MPNLCTNECYEFLKNYYSDRHDCEEIITDLCNCFDSIHLTDFVDYLKFIYDE